MSGCTNFCNIGLFEQALSDAFGFEGVFGVNGRHYVNRNKEFFDAYRELYRSGITSRTGLAINLYNQGWRYFDPMDEWPDWEPETPWFYHVTVGKPRNPCG